MHCMNIKFHQKGCFWGFGEILRIMYTTLSSSSEAEPKGEAQSKDLGSMGNALLKWTASTAQTCPHPDPSTTFHSARDDGKVEWEEVPMRRTTLTCALNPRAGILAGT